MNQERIPAEEIAAEMRKAAIEHLEDVKWAVLETGGRISIIGRRPDDVRPPPDEENLT